MAERELSLEERARSIVEACATQTSASPVEVFEALASLDVVRMHGPEHHVLDGACVLTAFRNAGGQIDLDAALRELMRRGLSMPGGACGYWGTDGAAMSVGAALSIIEETGPVTPGDAWGSHMDFVAGCLRRMAAIGGPRCCKRNAYVALDEAVGYVRERYGVPLARVRPACHHAARNRQCLGARCPFSPARSLT